MQDWAATGSFDVVDVRKISNRHYGTLHEEFHIYAYDAANNYKFKTWHTGEASLLEEVNNWLKRGATPRNDEAKSAVERITNEPIKIAAPVGTVNKIGWQYYKNGEVADISELEARTMFDSWKIFSDEKGAATFLIDQMWNEIDRLRSEVAKKTPLTLV